MTETFEYACIPGITEILPHGASGRAVDNMIPERPICIIFIM